jgi:phosphate acetyltransferase
MLSTLPIECPAFLLDTASLLPRATTAVVNAGSTLVLQSCRLASDEGLIEPVLIGDRGAIASTAQQIDWDISDIRIIHAPDDIASAQVAVALARGGEVASLMKGNIHTDDLLRAVINKQTGLRTGTRLSHVFHMTIPGSDQSLCITDAVINVLPSMNIQLDIARNATKLMHSLGNSAPKIAVLSATEIANEGLPSSMQAAEVVKHAEQGEVPGAVLGGPFAFDNAVSPAAAKLKKIDHTVAGHADVLLVPNIETGNALFKQMVYFMSAAAAGVVLGAKVPIILTSRADPAVARLASTALASIYADYCVNLSA